MRKWLIGVLGGIGALSPGICFAAFVIFQTYSGPPQIFYNIVTDGGATCNGDVQTVTRAVTITSGTKNLAVDADTFVVGDVGKSIFVTGNFTNRNGYSTIATYVDARNVVVADNANVTQSAVSTGVTFGTDDAPEFMTFNSWARANQGASNQVVLTIPPGSTCWFGSRNVPYITVQNAFAAGINNLLVEGNNSTITSYNGSGFSLGGLGTCQAGLSQANGCTARIQSVSAGSSTVTLTAVSLAAGYISRFPTGKWILISGLDVQGLFIAPYGYPANPNVFEWRQVISADAGTGVVTLDRPLSYAYLSTWPQFNEGNVFEADATGPATITAVGAAQNVWNMTLEYRNITFIQSGQVYAVARSVTYRNCHFPIGGAIPTQNETWAAYDSTWADTMEVDKMIGTMIFDRSTIPLMQFQSASVQTFYATGSTFTSSLQGAGKSTYITDSNFGELHPNSYAYGNAQGAFVCTRCNVTTADNDMLEISPTINRTDGVAAPMSMTAGVISWPITYTEYQRGFAPIGGNYTWRNQGSFAGIIGVFQVLSVTADGWPSADYQSATTNVSITSGTNALSVSTAIFASGDVGKVILVPGATLGSTLKTVITGFTDAQNVTLLNNANTTLTASSKTVEWGTSNIYVTTNEAGSFPTATACCLIGGLTAPQFTCDACTGAAPFTDMNIQNGATPGAPMASFSKRSFAPVAATVFPQMYGRGYFSSLTIDVTQAYTGSGNSQLRVQQFGVNFMEQATWSYANFNPVINLKVAGTRVFTPAGVTCNGVAGGCSGDTGMVAPTATTWVPRGFTPRVDNTTMVGPTFPEFTITFETDPNASVPVPGQ